jgi:hypothetical protein
MKLSLALIAGFALFNASAQAAVQSIDCRFVDTTNTDHVMVTLNSDQAGTFFYSTGEDDEGSTTSSGKLILKRGKPITTGLASFLADVVIPEGSGSVQFTFEYPEASVMKAGTDVKAKLTTEIFGIRPATRTDNIGGSSADTQDLLCNAKLI